MITFKSLILLATVAAMSGIEVTTAEKPFCPVFQGNKCPPADCLSDPSNWEFQKLIPIHGGRPMVSAKLKNCLIKSGSLATVLGINHSQKCTFQKNTNVGAGKTLFSTNVPASKFKCGGDFSLFVFDEQFNAKEYRPAPQNTCKELVDLYNLGKNSCQICSYENIKIPLPKKLCDGSPLEEPSPSGPCDGKGIESGACDPPVPAEDEVQSGPCDGKGIASGACNPPVPGEGDAPSGPCDGKAIAAGLC